VLAQPAADLKAMVDARQKREEILSQRHDLSDERVRAEVVRQLRAVDAVQQAAVRRRARVRGLALEGDKPGGGRIVLVDFDENDQPVYHQTENNNAAISTAAKLVRSTAPYNVSGSGVKIGQWEAGGIPRQTHREIVGRISIADSATTETSHATHVAGTLAAAGITPSALGMAPAATLVCYNSTSDTTEMTAAGAAAPNTTKIYLSNHSYGALAGWEGNAWHGAFTNDGNPANDVETDFGRYSQTSRNFDTLAYNLPYYQVFVSTGNHRNDTPPTTGGTWTFAGTSYTYDPAQHPKGDGLYKSGYDNIEGNKLAKNVISVGSVNDAVSGGVRNPAAASISGFSSWGPADDGRIKPDIMANGDSLYSCVNSSDTSYNYSSGTSMASPNACGSAALLISYYTSRFPGGAMRASTLKSLIIHTADDLGTAGPDYKNGWGLMNTKAAAEIIRLHADNIGGAAIIESAVSTALTSRTFTHQWDGTTPLRVTLGWTDPAGASRTNHDNRNKALVNDLNLTVTREGGSTYYPFVMPYVNNWSTNLLSAAAVNGVNTVDNTEQVYLAAPEAGTYVITVNYAGSLTNGAQNFSLIVSGETNPLPDPVFNYTEVFDGGGAALNGKVSTTGEGVWNANSLVTGNGVLTADAGSALLPFTPVADKIYTLSLDFNYSSGSGGWLGLGFSSSTAASAPGASSTADRLSNLNVPGYAWMISNGNSIVGAWQGLQTENPVPYTSPTLRSGSRKLKIVLNTAGNGSSFTADYFIDQTSVTNGPVTINVPLFTLKSAGFTQYGNGLLTGSVIDNFSLTTDDIKLPGYATWATVSGIDGELAAGDFDNDGLANLVEYALGLDPTKSSVPPGTLLDGNLSFNKGADAVANGDVTYVIEESDDLGVADPWAEVTPDVNDTTTISYQLLNGPGRPKVFARLKIVQIP
jgi:hypothetical protein